MTAADTLTVLKLLAKGRPPEFIADATRLPIGYVQSIADKHGWPDGQRVQSAVDNLGLLAAAPRIPVREPTTSRPSPTPAALDPRPALPAAGGTPTEQLQRVPIGRVHPDPDNPRTALGELSDLASSLRTAGMIQPIVVRRAPDGRLTIVAGHRRYAAAKLAGWDTVPVIVRRDMHPDAVLAAMLIENGHRQDLDPIDEARGLRRLQTQLGECSHNALAKRVGRTQVHVSGRLALLALTPDEQDAVRTGAMNLADGIRRARLASGRIRDTSTGAPHLGIEHALAARARARCTRLQHKRHGRNSVGGVACGECWESVIRADERDHLHHATAMKGACVLCDTPIEPAETATTLRSQTA